MDFGATISRALKITWQHKSLWLIALIPTLVGLVAVIPFFVVFFGAMVAGLASMGAGGEDAMQAVFGTLGVGVLAAYCLLFVGYIAIIVVTLISQGALIEGVRQAEDEGRVQFGRAMGAGWRNAGKLFVSSMVIALPVFGILCVGFAGVMAVALGAEGGLASRSNEETFAAIFSGGLCAFLGVYCVILLYALFASGIQVMSERTIVLYNTGPMEGLRRGWQLFRSNLGSIFLLAIVIIGVQLIVSFVINIGSQVVLLPVMGPLSQLGTGAGVQDIQRVFTGLLTASFGLAFILIMLVSLIWGLLFGIFNSAAWTLAYRQFVGRDSASSTSFPLPPATPSIPELR